MAAIDPRNINAVLLVANFFLVMANLGLVIFQFANIKKAKTLIDALKKANGSIMIDRN